MELEYYCKDGTTVWAESKFSIIRDGSGKAVSILGEGRDITERKQAEEALRESEVQLSASMENAPDGVYMNDLEGNFLYGNRRCEEIIGYKREELIGKNFLELNILPENSLAKAAKLLQDNINGKSTGPDELELIRKDGRRVPIEINTSVVPRKGQAVVLAFVRDITERKKAEEALKESEERYRALFDRSLDLVYVRDLKGNFLDANPAALNLLGYQREDIPTLNFASLLSPAQFPKTIQILKELTETGFQREPSEYKLKRKDGTHLYVETQESVVYRYGEPHSVQGIGRDITERKRMEQKLEEMATHDFLTGLPNRILLNDRFQVALAQANRNNYKLGIMSLDLDRFKEVNDTMGHAVGDELLKAVAIRLSNILRSSDTVARLGGDEFLLLLQEIHGPEDAILIAEKIVDSCKEPLQIDGHRLYISTSIGIAIYPDHGEDVDTLMRKSDAAMYFSKRHGGMQYKVFTTSDQLDIIQSSYNDQAASFL
jgi:diguanylate cyclase (GGDEF)-like protein/PAS domain S-box-containing protein